MYIWSIMELNIVVSNGTIKHLQKPIFTNMYNLSTKELNIIVSNVNMCNLSTIESNRVVSNMTIKLL